MLSILAAGKMLTPSFKSTVSQGLYDDMGIMKTTVYNLIDRVGSSMSSERVVHLLLFCFQNDAVYERPCSAQLVHVLKGYTLCHCLSKVFK